MIFRSLPPRFLCGLPVLSWRDIPWGISRGFITWPDTAKLALCLADEHSSPEELALAAADPADEEMVRATFERLVPERSLEAGDTQDRWLFAILMYAFETADSVAELQARVEDLFCDVNHPEVMYDFISYMPHPDGHDPSLHTNLENKRHRIRLIHDYLERTAQRFGVRGPSREATSIP